MWDSIWINANLATMSGETGYGTIENSFIAVAGGKIAALGALDGRDPQTLATQVHNAGGKWITPGLIDCHTHLVYGGNRAQEFEMRLNGATYEDIARAGGGIISTVKATRKADEDTLYKESRARLLTLMREGVTTVEIKSGYGLDLESEARCLRVATRLGQDLNISVQRTFLGAHALPPEYAGRADDYIAHICDTMLPALHAEGLIDAVDAFCETIAFSVQQTARVFEKATALGIPVKLHAEQLSNSGGAALAASFKALSADHLEYLDEHGIESMAQSGTVAVLLPGAFYFLRERQLPPVDLLRRYGVPIAIATDSNPGSSPTCSLLLMMNMACTLFRMTPEETLAGVTRNAAKALGYNDCGILKEGMNADFVLWNISHPAELSYRFGYNPCAGLVIAGSYVDLPQA